MVNIVECMIEMPVLPHRITLILADVRELTFRLRTGRIDNPHVATEDGEGHLFLGRLYK